MSNIRNSNKLEICELTEYIGNINYAKNNFNKDYKNILNFCFTKKKCLNKLESIIMNLLLLITKSENIKKKLYTIFLDKFIEYIVYEIESNWNNKQLLPLIVNNLFYIFQKEINNKIMIISNLAIKTVMILGDKINQMDSLFKPSEFVEKLIYLLKNNNLNNQKYALKIIRRIIDLDVFSNYRKTLSINILNLLSYTKDDEILIMCINNVIFFEEYQNYIWKLLLKLEDKYCLMIFNKILENDFNFNKININVKLLIIEKFYNSNNKDYKNIIDKYFIKFYINIKYDIYSNLLDLINDFQIYYFGFFKEYKKLIHLFLKNIFNLLSNDFIILLIKKIESSILNLNTNESNENILLIYYCYKYIPKNKDLIEKNDIFLYLRNQSININCYLNFFELLFLDNNSLGVYLISKLIFYKLNLSNFLENDTKEIIENTIKNLLINFKKEKLDILEIYNNFKRNIENTVEDDIDYGEGDITNQNYIIKDIYENALNFEIEYLTFNKKFKMIISKIDSIESILKILLLILNNDYKDFSLFIFKIKYEINDLNKLNENDTLIIFRDKLINQINSNINNKILINIKDLIYDIPNNTIFYKKSKNKNMIIDKYKELVKINFEINFHYYLIFHILYYSFKYFDFEFNHLTKGKMSTFFSQFLDDFDFIFNPYLDYVFAITILLFFQKTKNITNLTSGIKTFLDNENSLIKPQKEIICIKFYFDLLLIFKKDIITLKYKIDNEQNKENDNFVKILDDIDIIFYIIKEIFFQREINTYCIIIEGYCKLLNINFIFSEDNEEIIFDLLIFILIGDLDSDKIKEAIIFLKNYLIIFLNKNYENRLIISKSILILVFFIQKIIKKHEALKDHNGDILIEITNFIISILNIINSNIKSIVIENYDYIKNNEFGPEELIIIMLLEESIKNNNNNILSLLNTIILHFKFYENSSIVKISYIEESLKKLENKNKININKFKIILNEKIDELNRLKKELNDEFIEDNLEYIENLNHDYLKNKDFIFGIVKSKYNIYKDNDLIYDKYQIKISKRILKRKKNLIK